MAAALTIKLENPSGDNQVVKLFHGMVNRYSKNNIDNGIVIANFDYSVSAFTYAMLLNSNLLFARFTNSCNGLHIVYGKASENGYESIDTVRENKYYEITPQTGFDLTLFPNQKIELTIFLSKERQ
jgi:hypothetical protein